MADTLHCRLCRQGRIFEITAHLYPGGAGNKVVATPEIGRDRMLSGEFEKVYHSLADTVIPMAASDNLGFRIEEGNNYYDGGARNVSRHVCSHPLGTRLPLVVGVPRGDGDELPHR